MTVSSYEQKLLAAGIQNPAAHYMANPRTSGSDIAAAGTEFYTARQVVKFNTLPREIPTCFSVPNNGVVLAGGGYEGAFTRKSTDGGFTWEAAKSLGSVDACVNAILHVSGSIYIVGTGYDGPAKIFRTTDAGDTWTLAMSFVNPTYPYDETSRFLKLDSGVIFVGLYAGDIYKSADLGITWTHVHKLPDLHGFGTMLDMGNGVIVVGGSAGDYPGRAVFSRSFDSGETWEPLSFLPSGRAASSLTRCSDGRLLAAVWSPDALYKSFDLGATWELMPAPPTDMRGIVEFNPGVLLTADTGDGAFYKSLDFGETWAKLLKLDGYDYGGNLCKLNEDTFLTSGYPKYDSTRIDSGIYIINKGKL